MMVKYIFAIECYSVYKYYSIDGRKICALNNVDLKVRYGEILGVLGPNGSGKTTLLKIISGLMLPDYGNVYVLNHSLKKEPRIVKSLVNFISGSSMISGVDYYSVIGLLNFYADFYGVKNVKERVSEVIEVLGLKEYLHENPLLLSSGFRERVELSRLFLIKTPILLLDEPTAHLDPMASNIIRNYVKKLAKDFNVTVLWATHFPDEIENICDEVIIMNEGRILDVGSSRSLKDKYLRNIEWILKVKALHLSKELSKLLMERFKVFSTMEIYDDSFGEGLLKIYVWKGENVEEYLNFLNTCNVKILSVRKIPPSLSDIYNFIIGFGDIFGK